MKLSKNDIEHDRAIDLIAEVAKAHQLLAAFYQRLMPIFDEVGSCLGLGFWHWDSYFDRPKLKKNPCYENPWGFAPLFSFYVSFWNDPEGSARREDIAISFDVHFNDMFIHADGEPVHDPLILGASNSVVRVYVYRPCKNLRKKTLEELWWDSETWGKPHSEWRPTSTGELESISWEWPLADVICDPRVLLDKLEPVCEEAKLRVGSK